MGLFIAKAIIEILGGEVGFSSEESKGSTFWFTIPTAKTPITHVGIGVEHPAA